MDIDSVFYYIGSSNSRQHIAHYYAVEIEFTSKHNSGNSNSIVKTFGDLDLGLRKWNKSKLEMGNLLSKLHSENTLQELFLNGDLMASSYKKLEGMH